MSCEKQESKTRRKRAKIIIVDDHPIVRQGLAELINHQKDLEVCEEVSTSYEAIKAVRQSKPDMIIVDISLADTNGIELIKDLKVQHPDLPVLALSMHDETLYAERALRAGARGYIMKQQGTETLIKAIRKVLNGQIYLSDRMASKVVSKLAGRKINAGESPIELLSDRELEVFLLIGKGHGTREISQRLHLSVKTIESYRSHIKEKLNLSDASELLRYAIQWNK